ncbi:MAG: type 4a pilus biogenesis protein PilO [Gammaproteobacteria bacterium]|nr:type 4a pilus biogenesis protein PilO [Gammaproteobacteria bacterium]
MNLQELNELDLSNIGSWPGPVKAILILIICILMGVGWYYFNTADQLARLEKEQRQELKLRKTFEKKQAKAVNLEKYKAQLDDMKQSFGTMLRQLPNKTEVAELLVDVSQTGLATGLEFELFDPMGEKRKEFYAELPIKIRVKGEYHQFGSFISGLASLPRIVTIHNIRIKPKKGKRRGRLLVMDAIVKTYRYLDQEGGK